MSQAKIAFEYSIQDAEDLLSHFDAINTKPPPKNAEVLKKAGLVMALTSWETYVEDRVTEEMDKRLQVVSGSYVGDFISKKLQQTLKSFNTPNAEKTRHLFIEYLDIDITTGWSWANNVPATAKKTLNKWIKMRGEAVHRSKSSNHNAPPPHLVKRGDLDKCIRFIKDLVSATDKYLDKEI